MNVDKSYCRHCGYSLRGLSTRTCPECGREFDPDNSDTYADHPYGSHRGNPARAVVLGTPFALVLLSAVWACHWHPVFSIWLCFPVVGGLIVTLKSRGSYRPFAAAGWAFSIVAAGVTGLFSLAWSLDWGGTATGSSTAGVAFIFIPIWSIGLGGFAALIAFAVGSFISDD